MPKSIHALVKRWLALPAFVQQHIMKNLEHERAAAYLSEAEQTPADQKSAPPESEPND
jgi:hypothetical protein